MNNQRTNSGSWASRRSWQFDSLGDSMPSGVRLAEPEVLTDTFKALDLCAVLHQVLG